MTAVTLPSRIQGPAKILKQLRTLHGQTRKLRDRNDRAGEHRAVTPEEHQWCRRTGDTLDRCLRQLATAIDEGVVLPAHPDPRDQRRVRKSKR